MVAAAIGGAALGSVVGGVVQGDASENAAKTQANAANNAASIQQQESTAALQQQLGIYNQTRSDLAPYLSTGTSALNQLSSLFGIGSGGLSSGSAANATSALANYPGYQFQQQQGLQALDRSAASRGLLLSGGQLKDAETFGQGLAQNSFGNYTSLLSSLGSLGENAGAITGNAGNATSSGIANNLITSGQGIASDVLNAGQATAAGTVGSANALTSGLNSGIQNSILGLALQNGGGSTFNAANNSGAVSQAVYSGDPYYP